MTDLVDGLRELGLRLDALPETVAAAAAPRVEAKLRTDATTRRGNVPEGIGARAEDDAVVVTAPDWVLRKAEQKGQPEAWGEIVDEEVARALDAGR